MVDLFFRSVPSDSNAADIRFYDPTVGDGTTGAATGTVSNTTGTAAGTHGVRAASAAGSTSGTNGASAGTHGVRAASAAGSTTPVTGSASSTPVVVAAPFSNTGYGGTLHARKRVEIDSDKQRDKAIRYLRAKFWPVEGAAFGRIAGVRGLAAFVAGATLEAAGEINRMTGKSAGEYMQFSDSEMDEILAIIEDIESVEDLELVDA